MYKRQEGTSKGIKTLDNFLDVWMHGVSGGLRAPVLRRPSDVGLEYEDVFFTSMDGIALEGWFIPADSDQLVIQNHFLPGNRYGYPGHLPEFNSVGGFEINLMGWYKALHDAGYNILTYDLRNHGLSGAANGGVVGMGPVSYTHLDVYKRQADRGDTGRRRGARAQRPGDDPAAGGRRGRQRSRRSIRHARHGGDRAPGGGPRPAAAS